jgi:hypothetical protein
MNVPALGSLGARRIVRGSSDLLDYLVGILIIGLLVLGGTLWTSRHGEVVGPPPQFPSSRSWLQWDPTRQAFEWPRRAGGQGTDATQEILIPEETPWPLRVVPAYYTEQALNAGFHGRVFVTIFVDALGTPQEIEPTSPIPFGLELPVRQAILQWRFQPALSRGVAVASKTVVEVPFATLTTR